MYESIGIDLGSSRVVVSTAGVGIVSSIDPQAVPRLPEGFLTENGERTDQNAAVRDAEVVRGRMFGESTISPEKTRLVLKEAIERFGGGACERLLLSIPCSFSEVEEAALSEMAIEAGAAEVHLVYAPIAALCGSELDLGANAVLVDIGMTMTNVVAVCHGRIFYKKTYPVGGASFDGAIARYLLKRHKVEVDLATAETVKLGVGTVWVSSEEKTIEVRGRDATNGDYCKIRVSSEEMFTALEEPMAALIEGVCETITKIPADCVHDVFDTGILLSGGGALLQGIEKMIGGITGVNTSHLVAPRDAVATGLAHLLDEAKDQKALGTRNISRYIMKKMVKAKGGA